MMRMPAPLVAYVAFLCCLLRIMMLWSPIDAGCCCFLHNERSNRNEKSWTYIKQMELFRDIWLAQSQGRWGKNARRVCHTDTALRCQDVKFVLFLFLLQTGCLASQPVTTPLRPRRSRRHPHGTRLGAHWWHLRNIFAG